VQLGRNVTRGLGTGGDPEVGFAAACESSDEIRQTISDARLVFICAGLGGGTGSGAAPLIARTARENGSLVIALATMPFAFEGKRRTAQANEALARLRESADAVICFENDRIGDIVAPRAGIHQAFAAADMTISQSVRSIVNVIQRPGLIRIGFDDLMTALRAPNGRCVFGFGESDSDNRAHDALTQALKNPLMERGRVLTETDAVLVQVAGGPGMTLTEVEILMRELQKHVDDRTQILFGTAVDNRMGNRLSVTIIGSVAGEPEIAPGPTLTLRVAHEPEPQPIAPPPASEPIFAEPPAPLASELQSIEAKFETPAEPDLRIVEEETVEPPPLIEPVGDPAFEAPPIEEPAPPRVIPPKRKPIAPHPPSELPLGMPQPAVKAKRDKAGQAKQEVLQFEPVTRGRFEKSEPTIVEGQDLDVPTFLRKNVRVK
jgi:cell division protein FtsZ